MTSETSQIVYPEPRSVYIHVPFCIHRCGYCDFTVVAGRDQLIPAYLDALELELQRLVVPQEMDTIYVGGGTPTYLPPRELKRLVSLLRYWFRFSSELEFTFEANPDGLTRDHLEVLSAGHVNRISLGVQAFDDGTLQFLERKHRRGDIERAVRLVQDYVANVSLDLIFGVPGQSLSTWSETIDRALQLNPAHVSAYGLTYEKGTRFWSRRNKGELRQIAEELESEMYEITMDRLARHGLEQYEISSFARPGYRSRHNQVYWTGLPYDAFGPGAARYIRGCREANHRSVSVWIRRLQQGLSPVFESEKLSCEDRARELLVLGLRRCDGIRRDEFARLHGFHPQDLAGDALRRHIQAGFIEVVEPDTIRLTRAGRMVADGVIVDLL